MFKIFRFNCCGLDVHKTWIYACIAITDSNGRTEYKKNHFSSFSKGLRELDEWLTLYSCDEDCMKSSGKEQAIKLRRCLEHIDQLKEHKQSIKDKILTISKNYSETLELLRTIPGFDRNPITAITVLSEIGNDMTVFPSAKHLCSWSGCCPRNDQSNQRVKCRRISQTGTYLKPILVQIANALIKSKSHTEFVERYRRLKARRYHKKAIIVICKMLLTAIWNILSKHVPYTNEGYFTSSPNIKKKGCLLPHKLLPYYDCKAIP